MLHQVGVSFDLYYDARKHKIKTILVFNNVLQHVTHRYGYESVIEVKTADLTRKFKWVVERSLKYDINSILI